MPIIISIAVLAVIALLVLFFAWWKMNAKRYLSGGAAQKYLHAWAKIPTIGDDHRKIMEADKILDQALFELGYQGSFADKLRKAQARFGNREQLWAAHKLRNRIAHEMGVAIDPREVTNALHTFERALKSLLRD